MQFDVYPSLRGDSPGSPILIDIQADLLSGLPTRLMVPLLPAGVFGRRVSRLHPLLMFGGESCVLATHLLAAVERRRLGRAIGSLAQDRDAIVAAVDVLLAGI